MEERQKVQPSEVSVQIDKIRKLYSKIGQPLPAETIIDLHLSLGKALEINRLVPEHKKLSRN